MESYWLIQGNLEVYAVDFHGHFLNYLILIEGFLKGIEIHLYYVTPCFVQASHIFKDLFQLFAHKNDYVFHFRTLIERDFVLIVKLKPLLENDFVLNLILVHMFEQTSFSALVFPLILLYGYFSALNLSV